MDSTLDKLPSWADDAPARAVLAALGPDARFVGGCVRLLAERRGAVAEGTSDPGVLAASGLVAGEGLAGVAIAALVGMGVAPKTGTAAIGGTTGMAVGALVVVALCAFMWKAGDRKDASQPA
ncbi:MAG: hypothetical protein IBJ15_19425 [Alphaproteobacteria bacterium]|nr:hypothetical protein [Alphaproteobacteria bacterium]